MLFSALIPFTLRSVILDNCSLVELSVMTTPPSTVKGTMLDVHEVAAGVTTLEVVITAGTAWAAEPIVKQALAVLQAASGHCADVLGTSSRRPPRGCLLGENCG
jgi:hypothetical protein